MGTEASYDDMVHNEYKANGIWFHLTYNTIGNQKYTQIINVDPHSHYHKWDELALGEKSRYLVTNSSIDKNFSTPQLK